MKNKLLEEIISFKNEVKINGMYVETYISKRKELLGKINCASDKGMYFIKILCFYSFISKEQYLELKWKIDEARKYYKKILSFY